MKLGLEAGKETLDLAVAHAVQGVPVSAGDLVTKGVDETLTPLRELGLSVCQIGAFGFNALRVDPEQRRVLEAAIPLAAQTGCPYIVIGPGNYHASAFGAVDKRNFTNEALDEMATVLEPLATLAEEHGAKLSIEAYLKGAVNGADRFLDLWGRVQSAAEAQRSLSLLRCAYQASCLSAPTNTSTPCTIDSSEVYSSGR